MRPAFLSSRGGAGRQGRHAEQAAAERKRHNSLGPRTSLRFTARSSSSAQGQWSHDVESRLRAVVQHPAPGKIGAEARVQQWLRLHSSSPQDLILLFDEPSPAVPCAVAGGQLRGRRVVDMGSITNGAAPHPLSAPECPVARYEGQAVVFCWQPDHCFETTPVVFQEWGGPRPCVHDLPFAPP